MTKIGEKVSVEGKYIKNNRCSCCVSSQLMTAFLRLCLPRCENCLVGEERERVREREGERERERERERDLSHSQQRSWESALCPALSRRRRCCWWCVCLTRRARKCWKKSSIQFFDEKTKDRKTTATRFFRPIFAKNNVFGRNMKNDDDDDV